jgi:hypothetical protein
MGIDFFNICDIIISESEVTNMKVYVLYISSDYAHAIHMSIDKKFCEREMKACQKRGVKQRMWIEEYDFSKKEEYELNCD